MNEVQQKVFVTTIITASIVLHAALFTLTIRLARSGDWLMCAFFAFLTTDTLGVFVVLIGCMSKVHVTSHKMFEKLRCQACKLNKMDKRLWNRLNRSCTNIRVKFGSLNYIDRLTPLNCLDFANNLTYNILLLSR